MLSRLTFTALICLSFNAAAQDVPDLTGRWTYEASGLEADPRCGQIQEFGELAIERKIAARAYRGKMRLERSFERCQGAARESVATIRVKDEGLVTVDFDEDGWEMQQLRFTDGEMTGDMGGGTTSRWVRAHEQGADDGPTTEQLAALEAFLEQVKPDLSTTLRAEYYENLRKNLWKSGLSTEDAVQVAGVTIERMTSCMLDMMRESVLEQEIPVDQILEQQNVSVIFNPQSVDIRASTCVQDAAWNAGVPIR
jgi:hypothetical protein